MPIESHRAGQEQLKAEARSEFAPGIAIAIEIAKNAAGIAGLELPRFLELCLTALAKNSRENLSYLFECLVEDVKRLGIRVERFEHYQETERRALDQLVSEAVARTAEAKSKDRVRRIARILANALRSGPKDNYERERELSLSPTPKYSA